MNIQRINAIFEKDLKDFMKNTMLIFTPVVPIILAIFYNRMGNGEELSLYLLYLVVGITFSSVTSGSVMMMMAEENEKDTLRGLIMSPASFLDIILGKSLVTGLMTLLTLVVSLLILGVGPILNIRAIIGLVLLFLFFLLLGIAIGLFVKSVGATTVYLMPIMFLFGFTPMIEALGLSESSIIVKIAHYFPVSQLIEMHEANSWMPLGIVLIWVLVAALFSFICFKKTAQD